MATAQSSGLAYVKYISNGSDVIYSFDFDYLFESDVKVYIDDTLLNPSEYWVDVNKQVNLVQPAGVGRIVYIRRETENVEPLVRYVNQSSLNKEDLNKTNNQVLFVMAEVLDELNQKLNTGSGDNEILNDMNMNGFKILNLGRSDEDSSAITYGRVKELIGEIKVGNVIVEEEIVATQGQTVFKLNTFEYDPGYGQITVSIQGLSQAMSDFTESDVDEVTMDEGLNEGDRIVIRKSDNPTSHLNILQADYDVLGGVLLATNEEALAGTDRFKAITAESLAYVLQRFAPQQATTSQYGIVKLASGVIPTGEGTVVSPDQSKYIAQQEVNNKFIISTNEPSGDASDYDLGTIYLVIEE